MKDKILVCSTGGYRILENLNQSELDEIINITIKGKSSTGILSPAIEKAILSTSNGISIINKTPNGPAGYSTTKRKIHYVYSKSHKGCNLDKLDVNNIAVGINAQVSDIETEYYPLKFKVCG